jgi:hypothetical protein
MSIKYYFLLLFYYFSLSYFYFFILSSLVFSVLSLSLKTHQVFSLCLYLCLRSDWVPRSQVLLHTLLVETMVRKWRILTKHEGLADCEPTYLFIYFWNKIMVFHHSLQDLNK